MGRWRRWRFCGQGWRKVASEAAAQALMLPGEDGEAQLGFGEKKGASDVVTEVHSVLVERLTAQLLTRIYEKDSD